MPRRLKVLLSAYFFSPYKGSESGLGWNVACRLASHHDVTVLCGDFHSSHPTRKDLERYGAERGLPDGLTIEHVPGDAIVRFWNRIHKLPGLWFCYYIAYRRWQKLAFLRAKKLHRRQPFDLAHHLNIIGYREPGYLWKLEIPFFWGPLTGAVTFPNDFLRDFSLAERMRWGTRNLLNRWQSRGSRRCLRAARKATKIWAVTPDDLSMLRNHWGVDAELMLETGATSHTKQPTLETEFTPHPASPLRLVWSGLFLGIKALPILLHALKRLPAADFRLDVLGDGPEATRWKQLADSLQIGDRVCFQGYLAKDEAINIMRQSHVLVHTSVKEGTPHVVLEALTMGIPVVCHQSCGMDVAVDDSSGIKVPVVGFQESVIGFAEALASLHADRKWLQSLKDGARLRAAELSWDHMIERIQQSYRSAE
jgi:glycosyltransferase involved in cell wall biosynthesis